MRPYLHRTLCLALAWRFTTLVCGQPGALDNSFGQGGIVLTSVDTAVSECHAIIAKNDGRILMGGYFLGNAGTAQLLEDGSFDGAYGTGGVSSALGTAGFSDVLDMALLDDQRFLVGGQSGFSDFAVSRCLPNGDVDSTYGVSGIVEVDHGGQVDGIRRIAPQDSGGVICIGWSIDSLMNHTSVLFRIKEPGELDPLFGMNGFIEFPGISVNCVSIQIDGKILVGGSSIATGDVVILRMDQYGAMDPSFGVNGIQEVDAGTPYEESISSIVVDPQGWIYCFGSIRLFGTYNMMSMRLNTGGGVDQSYGTSGLSAIGMSGYDLLSLGGGHLRSDGSVVVTGFATNGSDLQFVLAKFDEVGLVDQSFGSAGLAATALPTQQNMAFCSALQYDGKVVLGGSASGNWTTELLVARFSTGYSQGFIIQNVAMLSDGHAYQGLAVRPAITEGPAVLYVECLLASVVSLNVLDVRGQLVMTLFANRRLSPGVHEVPFDLTGLPAGVYLISMSDAQRSSAVRVVVQ